MRFQSRFALLAAATVLTPPAVSAQPAAKSVPIPSLVRQVSIPHSMFRLSNGLTVIVHEDHKAPVVGVAMWYNVGSKDEPKGKTGFAAGFAASTGGVRTVAAASRTKRLEKRISVRVSGLSEGAGREP